MSEHITTVKLIRAWREYRPECECGWVGDYLTARAQAEKQADVHAATGDDPITSESYTKTQRRT